MSLIAAIQMCSSDNVDENLNTAGVLLKQAASNGTQLAVLPEMFPLISAKAGEKIALSEPYGRGKIQDFLAEHAAQLDMWIVGGTMPMMSAQKTRAACLVYNNHGVCVTRYDKIHLFDAAVSDDEYYRESDSTEPGDTLVVVETPVGKLGLAVCYDIRFPGLFTHLLNQGAELIAVPSAFTLTTGEPHWHLLTRCRAIDNFCYIIGSNQGGTHRNGRKTYGHSLIVNPWGSIIAEMQGTSEGVIYATIDLDVLHKIRASIPIVSHQKIRPDISCLSI